jgi:hypothetical protein
VAGKGLSYPEQVELLRAIAAELEAAAEASRLSAEQREALEVAKDDCEWRSQGQSKAGKLRSIWELEAAAATIRAMLEEK